MKLYRVGTTCHRFNGHKDVHFEWFLDEPYGEPRPYAELINGYADEADPPYYPMGAIDELFTLDQAQALVSYLDRVHGDAGEAKITAAKLPIELNMMGVGAIPTGGGQDFYMLAKEDEYNLPFKVYGYFDLRHHEPIDKSLPARHQFCSLYFIDGRWVHEYAELLELWRAG